METSQQTEYPCTYLESRQWGGNVVIHQKACPKCVNWLFENDIGQFEHVLNKALSRESEKGKHIVKFALQKKYISKTLDATSVDHPLFASVKNSCKAIRFPFEMDKIPHDSGVYFIVVNNRSYEKVVYVGSSLTIHTRLSSHHVAEIKNLIDWGVELLVYCLLFPAEGTEEAMRETERYFIRELQPPLNKKIRKEAHDQI